MQISTIEHEEQWREEMASCPDSDVYHSFDYSHLVSEEEGGVRRPLLFRAQSGCNRLLWPQIIREETIGGCPVVDAGSVYGYDGPVLDGDWDHLSLSSAWERILERLREMEVVSIVSRLNPIAENAEWLKSLGDVKEVGPTVLVELARSEQEQWTQYSANRRSEVRQLQRAGVSCSAEPWQTALPVFKDLYNETMERLSADSRYRFGDHYYEKLGQARDFGTSIYICRHAGTPICAGLFLIGRRAIHYHLSGSTPNSTIKAPTKLMLDQVRRDAKSSGLEYFHLGGGVGGREDSLYAFKSGFSRRKGLFHVFGAIVDQEAYSRLSTDHLAMAEKQGMAIDGSFFPAYRAPLVSVSSGA